MAGGTHHAHYDFGSGFASLTIQRFAPGLRTNVWAFERISILDQADVHQGDGTATVLADDDFARTISVHCAENRCKATSDYDFPIPQGTGDNAPKGGRERPQHRL